MKKYKEFIKIPEDLEESGYYFNINNNPIYLYHKNLQDSDEESIYRKKCPFCDCGVFYLRRDEKTYKILQDDRCSKCFQHVKFIDYKEII